MLKTAFAFLFLLSAPVFGASFELDPGHTEVRFIWSHGDVSEQSGKWGDVSGTVEFDRAAPEAIAANITLKSDSAVTGVGKLDDHLASSSFFKPKQYPEITFVSTGFTANSDTTGTMTGDLTIVGKTVEIVLDVTLTHEGEHPLGKRIKFFRGNWLGIKATSELKRSDWGLNFLAPLLSDEIRLEISAEMREGGW